jgi:hypothetical protein
MLISEQFAGTYFKAADLPVPRAMTIQTVTQETMPEGDSKPVMRFVGERQQLVLNKTNAFTCVELFGDESAAWQGQLVELYATTTSFSGHMVPCIRVRAPQQPQAAPAPQPAQQPPMQAPPSDFPVDA